MDKTLKHGGGWMLALGENTKTKEHKLFKLKLCHCKWAVNVSIYHSYDSLPSPFYYYDSQSTVVLRPRCPVVSVTPCHSTLHSVWFLFQYLVQEALSSSQSVREPCCCGGALTCCALTCCTLTLHSGCPSLALIYHWYCSNTAGHGDSAVDHSGLRPCPDRGWVDGLSDSLFTLHATP